MFRSVKYGLYGAVIAGVVSGTVAWQGVDKTVNLVVDGNRSSVHTTQATVADVLASRGYHVGAHDIVAPAARASVKNHATIVLQRGRLLVLDVNGARSEVWTTATTVAEAMAQLGYSTANFTSVSRDRRLPLTPTDLTIRTPQTVRIAHDGRVDQVATTDATVGQLLTDLGMALGAQDSVTPAADTAISDGLLVTVHRVVNSTITTNKVLPYPTTVKQDPNAPAGTTVVNSPGKNGLAHETWAVVEVDGKVVGKTLVSTHVVTAPTPKVVTVGTGPSAGGSGGTGGTAASIPAGAMATPAQAQALARQLMAQRGWGDDQFNCLAQLWGHESGWRVNAANPSGAYGIPQALPGSKMGAGWQTDAGVQISWGLGYIAADYGTPCGAWSSWQAKGWY